MAAVLCMAGCDSGHGIKKVISGYFPPAGRVLQTSNIYSNPLLTNFHPRTLTEAYHYYSVFLKRHVTNAGSLNYSSACNDQDSGLLPFLNYLGESANVQELRTTDIESAQALEINAYHAFAIGSDLNKVCEFKLPPAFGDTFRIRGIGGNDQITLPNLAQRIKSEVPASIFVLAEPDNGKNKPLPLSNIPYGFDPSTGRLTSFGAELEGIVRNYQLQIYDEAVRLTTEGAAAVELPELMLRYLRQNNEAKGDKKITTTTALNASMAADLQQMFGAVNGGGFKVVVDNVDAAQPRFLLQPTAAPVPPTTPPPYPNTVRVICILPGNDPAHDCVSVEAARAMLLDHFGNLRATRAVVSLVNAATMTEADIKKQRTLLGALLDRANEKPTNQVVAFVQLVVDSAGDLAAARELAAELMKEETFHPVFETPEQADGVCRDWPLFVVVDFVQNAPVLRSFKCESQLHSFASTENFIRSLR